MIADHGWFAARPSGTESIYKIYAESFQSPAHLLAIVHAAKSMVNKASLLRQLDTEPRCNHFRKLRRFRDR